MTRNRASAKKAGTAMETLVANYLAETLDDDRIERRARNGAKDRGDIGGVQSIMRERIVIEVKDYGGRLMPGPWLTEARIEAGNDDAPVAVVVAKRRGTTDPAKQYVLMELQDFARLIGGSPKHECDCPIDHTI